MVRRRTTHDKVGVRKAAVQALESLVRMEPGTKKEVGEDDTVSISMIGKVFLFCTWSSCFSFQFCVSHYCCVVSICFVVQCTLVHLLCGTMHTSASAWCTSLSVAVRSF